MNKGGTKRDKSRVKKLFQNKHKEKTFSNHKLERLNEQEKEKKTYK